MVKASVWRSTKQPCRKYSTPMSKCSRPHKTLAENTLLFWEHQTYSRECECNKSTRHTPTALT